MNFSLSIVRSDGSRLRLFKSMAGQPNIGGDNESAPNSMVRPTNNGCAKSTHLAANSPLSRPVRLHDRSRDRHRNEAGLRIGLWLPPRERV